MKLCMEDDKDFSIDDTHTSYLTMTLVPVVGGPKIGKNGQFVCLSTGFLNEFSVAAGTFPSYIR